jgi:uncharacterized protein (DUF58 family)
MNPSLTARGRWMFLTAVVFMLVGVSIQKPVLVLLGLVPVVLLVVAYLLCLPCALALDRRLVRLSFVEESEPLRPRRGYLAGDIVEGEIVVENRSTSWIHGLQLSPFASDELAARSVEGGMSISPGQGRSVRVELRPQRAGRWMVHGCDVSMTDPMGLLRGKDYLPVPFAVECYPRAGLLARPPRARTESQVQAEPGDQRRPRAVSAGLDIRQLRGYQPGDPMRQIAWKATARTRTLVSREYEQEVTLSIYVLLDHSSSMRAASDNGLKLDQAISLCTQIATAHLSARNRVGLMTFDDKVYGHVQGGNSMAHLGRLVHHLMGLSAVVDGDLTELDEVEVERLLVDYLLVQERLDFRKGSDVDPSTGINRALLKRWLSSVLPEEEARFASPTLQEGLMGAETTMARRFLQLRGVPVPYRVENRLGTKERGVLEAVERLVRAGGPRHHIIVLSDLYGVTNLDVLSRAIRLARARGHTMAFVVPTGPVRAEDEVSSSKRYQIMRELFSMAEAAERRRVVSRIRALGVSVEFVDPTVRHSFGHGL